MILWSSMMESSSSKTLNSYSWLFSSQLCDVLNRQVSYRCIQAKPNALQKVRVCEGQQASIDCPKRSKISIEYANYGRMKGPHVCGLFAFDTKCVAENSMDKVKEDCNNKDRCQLEATNAKFGDPCFGTQKYLEVRHLNCHPASRAFSYVTYGHT